MRFSDPSIVAGLKALADAGVTTVAAIILSPQYSPLLMTGYARAIDEPARRSVRLHRTSRSPEPGTRNRRSSPHSSVVSSRPSRRCHQRSGRRFAF
jgi:hypothetical protein